MVWGVGYIPDHDTMAEAQACHLLGSHSAAQVSGPKRSLRRPVPKAQVSPPAPQADTAKDSYVCLASMSLKKLLSAVATGLPIAVEKQQNGCLQRRSWAGGAPPPVPSQGHQMHRPRTTATGWRTVTLLSPAQFLYRHTST